MKIYDRIAALAAVFFCAGCASVVDGSTQPIYVTTTPETGATCICSNERGKWTVSTPGTVIVKKSESVLEIHCRKPGYKDGTAYAAGKETAAGLIGNALPYIGLLNAITDASTGAALTYPGSYTIDMQPVPAAAEKTPPAATQSPVESASSVQTSQ